MVAFRPPRQACLGCCSYLVFRGALELSASVFVIVTTGVDDLTQLTRFFGHDGMLHTSATGWVIVSFGTEKIGVEKVEPGEVRIEWVSSPGERLTELFRSGLRNNCFTEKFRR